MKVRVSESHGGQSEISIIVQHQICGFTELIVETSITTGNKAVLYLATPKEIV